MFFVAKAGSEYLTIKREEFQAERAAANAALTATEAALLEIVRQYRALKLPLAMPRPARILRELDRIELLGTDLMVVGANAFAAYEIEAGCRFLGGLEETEDFDLAWCRGAKIALARVAGNEAGSR